MPTAIGKSKRVPSFFKSAGARLTVIFFAGAGMPLFLSAVRMRLLLSFTAVSGNPNN